MKRFHSFDEFSTPHTRHDHIGEQKMNYFLDVFAGDADGLMAVGCLDHFVALVAKNSGSQSTQRRVILNKEYGFFSLWKMIGIVLDGKGTCFFLNAW